MTPVSVGAQVWLAAWVTDMPRGFSSLAAQTEAALRLTRGVASTSPVKAGYRSEKPFDGQVPAVQGEAQERRGAGLGVRRSSEPSAPSATQTSLPPDSISTR